MVVWCCRVPTLTLNSRFCSALSAEISSGWSALCCIHSGTHTITFVCHTNIWKWFLVFFYHRHYRAALYSTVKFHVYSPQIGHWKIGSCMQTEKSIVHYDVFKIACVIIISRIFDITLLIEGLPGLYTSIAIWNVTFRSKCRIVMPGV